MNEDQMLLMVQNIREAIRRFKKDEVCGATLDCLKQNTATTGMTCPVSVYHEYFPSVAIRIARQMGFGILQPHDELPDGVVSGGNYD